MDVKKKMKKHKKEKKHHKNKKRKNENKMEENRIMKPVSSTNEDAIFGPILPAHLSSKAENSSAESQDIPMIGPILPAELQKQLPQFTDEEDDEVTFGPLPASTSLAAMSVAHIELEQRALEMKLSKFDSIDKSSNEQKVREEWMLKLPDVGLKPGLASIGRVFHTGKERPDFSDRSDWTKTPNDEKRGEMKQQDKSDWEKNPQLMYEQQRDKAQEKIAKKLKKKQKRTESLLEMHQEKLKKEKIKKEKELAASNSKPERRPFSRDVDLKMNKIDRNQTKAIVDKAKILNTKFSSGQTKYL